jgi:hypothetical protein
MRRVAEFVPESGNSGAILMKQGFGGRWGFHYSADGTSRGAVPLDLPTMAVYDAAGQLKWKNERGLLTQSSHERQVPAFALMLARQAGLERQVPNAWSIDPASTTMMQLAFFAIFFVAGGLPVLAIVFGVVHLLSRGAYGALLRLSGTGSYRLSGSFAEALQRRRVATLVSGIFDIALGVVLGVVLYGFLFYVYTHGGAQSV